MTVIITTTIGNTMISRGYVEVDPTAFPNVAFKGVLFEKLYPNSSWVPGLLATDSEVIFFSWGVTASASYVLNTDKIRHTTHYDYAGVHPPFRHYWEDGTEVEYASCDGWYTGKIVGMDLVDEGGHIIRKVSDILPFDLRALSPSNLSLVESPVVIRPERVQDSLPPPSDAFMKSVARWCDLDD